MKKSLFLTKAMSFVALITVLNSCSKPETELITTNSESTSHRQKVVPLTGVTATNGVLSFTKSSTFGGAVVSYQYKGTEFIDVLDAGRELQVSAYGRSFAAFTENGFYFNPTFRSVINPTECGDAQNGRTSLPSPVVAISGTSTQVGSVCNPREWFWYTPGGWNMDINGHVYNTCIIESYVTIIPGYNGCVSKYEVYFKPPTTASWNLEVPALYVKSQFNRFYTLDAASGVRYGPYDNQTTEAKYMPASKIGGCIATTSTDGTSIGLYGASQSVGGKLEENNLFQFMKFSACAKMRANSWKGTFGPESKTYYSVYIVAGANPTEVKNQMVSMYNNGLR